MGLTNKIATKVRTAAKTVPTRLPTPFDDVGTLAASAIVRGAVAALSRTGLKSSGVTGHDILDIRSDRYAHASTLWYDQLNSRTWQIALGKPTAGGNIFDWQVMLAITADGSQQTAEVTTPAQLTKDGTLVNKAAHAELRDMLLNILASGRPATGKAERDVSTASLPTTTLAPQAQLALNATTQTLIRTSLTPERLGQALDLVPFTIAGKQPGQRSWRLDLNTSAASPGTAGSTATAHLERDGLSIHLQLRPSGNHVTDVLVAERGYALPRSVLTVIQLLDPGARIDTSSGHTS